MTDSTIGNLTAATAGAIPDSYRLEVADPTVANYKAKPSQLRAPTHVATTNPGVGNDNTQDYFVGATWFNSTLGGLWICKDASTGAAVWTGVGDTIIAEIITASSQANIDFTSIPATFRSLFVHITGQSTAASQIVQAYLQFNGDTAANYGGSESYATASVGNTQISGQGQAWLGEMEGASGDTRASTLLIEIPGYAQTTWSKSGHARVNMRQSGVGMQEWSSFDWNSTAAINEIRIFFASGNWTNGSIVTLWGRP